MDLLFPSIQRLREFKMKPPMTTECVDLNEPFLIEFSEVILADAESNNTRITKVDAETTDDD